ncbi:hypothetical protein BT96DRAFT_820862, partial [Gymnopus androsaceus JB14]
KKSLVQPQTLDQVRIPKSGRNSGKVIDYRKEKNSEDYIPDSFKAGIRVSKNSGPMGREDGNRVHESRVLSFPLFPILCN